jgi:hypothetical protein
MTMMEAKGATLFRPTIADQDVRSYDSSHSWSAARVRIGAKPKAFFGRRFLTSIPAPEMKALCGLHAIDQT